MPDGPIRLPGRFPGILPALVLSLVAVSPFHASAQPASSIGVYSDANRSSCSLSDQGGLINLYVVANTQYGATGVRFAAPKPACFNANWISDVVPQGFVTIGDSPTDISIAFGACVTGPVHVLTMVYQKTSDTAPCCEFLLTKTAVTDDVIFADCQFVEYAMPVAPGWINGDETCPCADEFDLPPSKPYNGSPQSGTINQALTLPLYWQSDDPEGQLLHYDLYLGTDPDPPLEATGLTTNGYVASGLAPSTTYYWKVVAFDPENHFAEGDVWHFTTGFPGPPPAAPVNQSPLDNATDQLRRLSLSWVDGPGGGIVYWYEIHLGTTPDAPEIGTASAGATSFEASGLALDTTYYWYIVAVGDLAQKTPGPTWSFHTGDTNTPPTAPVYSLPANAATGISLNPTLLWSASDPDGDTVEYDIYFGTTTDPPLFQHATTSFYGVNCAPLTVYYWRIVAIDGDGASTSGPEWFFRTRETGAPTVPALISPDDGSVTGTTGVQLAWSSTDPDGDPIKFTIYFGTTNPPPVYIPATNATLVNLPALATATTYYWQILATDNPNNLTTAGPVWSFTTVGPQSPLAPSNPNPSDTATDVFRKPTLGWYCSDPDSPNLLFDVYFGTTQPPPQVAWSISASQFTPSGPLPFFTLERGRIYYWKVVAHDPEAHTTEGPVWSFTTGYSDQSPTPPVAPYPADEALNQATQVVLQWQASDPEGLPLLYDVYFGDTSPPPLKASNLTVATHNVSGLNPATFYHWRVVVRDVDGHQVSSEEWTFRTSVNPSGEVTLGLYADEQGTYCRLADNGAGLRNVYVVLDGPETYTGCRFKAAVPSCFDATWLYDSTPYVTIGTSPEDVSIGFGFCLTPPVTVMTITYLSNGNTTGCCGFALTPTPFTDLLVTNCSFAELPAQSYPVLGISSNNSCPPCEESGFLRFSEAADTCRIGPSPRLVTVDVQLSPIDSVRAGGMSITFSPSLTFVSCERGALTQDWTQFDTNVAGNTIDISGTAHAAYDAQSIGVFARLTFETNCCEWADPAVLHFTDATGDLADLRLVEHTLPCRYAPDGDVNGDNQLTVADAQCALNAYLAVPGSCTSPTALIRADVNCSGAVTPADAYCIFRQWLDQSCSFCSGGSAPALAAGVVPPQLALRVVREGDEVVVVLRANGSGTVDALGLELTYPAGLEMLRIEPPRDDAYAALQTHVMAPGRMRIGAYANPDRGPSANGDLIAVRFRAPGAAIRGTVTASRFVDALAGAPDVSASLDGSAATPAVSDVVLHQNSPNPFNPRTSIRFELPDAMRVRLRIFDVHGRLVRLLLDERRDAGSSSVDWDGSDEHGHGVATGVYFYVLDAGSKRIQHKMVLLK